METSKSLTFLVKEDKANNRFIGSIQEKGFPIIVVGTTREELHEKMELALRTSCLLKNFQAVDKMLSANIYDMNIVETEAKKTNFKLSSVQ